MAFVTDKEVLKAGLIIFRRADVDHRNGYCRVKLPKADRYKTISLKTSDVGVARRLASEQEVEVRAMLKHDIPVFNHPFRAVAKESLAAQEARAKRGEISKERPKKLKAVIRHTEHTDVLNGRTIQNIYVLNDFTVKDIYVLACSSEKSICVLSLTPPRWPESIWIAV